MLRPHTIHLFSAHLPKTDHGEALSPGSLPESQHITCQVRPLSSETAYRRFGVEVKELFIVLCELEDAPRGGALDTLGTLVWWEEDALWLKVAQRARRYLADPQTQHALVLLERAPLRGGKPS